MSNLDHQIFKDIVNLLIPHCADPTSRKSLATIALFGCTVLDKLDYSGNARDYVVHFVTTLLTFGEYIPGKPAIVTVLEYISEEVGISQKAQIASLIPRISAKGLEVPIEHWRLFENLSETRYVFISYSQEDMPDVRRITTDLLDKGINVWIDQAGLRAGTVDWEQAIRDAIEGAYGVLFMASPSARRSNFVRDELAIAQAKNKPIYPIWIIGEERTDCIPMGLGYAQLLDARGDAYTVGLQQLIDILSKTNPQKISQAVNKIDTGKPIRNPYKGLRAFREEDKADFFGRNALVEELINVLGTGKKPPRLLSVLGASGSGKSSVIMAGLLPRLRADAIEGSKNWLYLEPIVPGTHPIENLTLALIRLMPDKSHIAITEDLMNRNKRGLHVLIREVSNKPVVLYIDQFEELFTLVSDETVRRQFIDILTTAVTELNGLLILILSMRADFYDRPAQYQEFGALIEANHILVKPMTLADLYDVVQKPAKENGLQFDDGLATEIVFNIREEVGALPLLQFTLDQLFESRDDRTLTQAAYKKLGGVHGALAQHAEETFNNLPSEQHKILSRVLFLRLIDTGLTDQDMTRRRAIGSELNLTDAEASLILRETAQIFVVARLLVTNQTGNENTIEVSHEALIREWDRLQNWINISRDDMRLQQDISRDARKWEREKRSTEYLYGETRLNEAKGWASRNAPSALEHDFIDAAIELELEQERSTRLSARKTALQSEIDIITRQFLRDQDDEITLHVLVVRAFLQIVISNTGGLFLKDKKTQKLKCLAGLGTSAEKLKNSVYPETDQQSIEIDKLNNPRIVNYEFSTDSFYGLAVPLYNATTNTLLGLLLAEIDASYNSKLDEDSVILDSFVKQIVFLLNQIHQKRGTQPNQFLSLLRNVIPTWRQNNRSTAALIEEMDSIKNEALGNMEQRIWELDVLSQLSQAINFTIEFDDLLEIIFNKTSKLVPAPAFYIVLYEEKIQRLYFAFFLEGDDRFYKKEGIRWSLGSDLFSDIIKNNTAIRLSNFTEEMKKRGAQLDLVKDDLSAWMGVPLTAGRRILGVMAVSKRNDNSEYTEEQFKIFNDIGSLAASSLDRANLFAQARIRERQLTILNDISRQLVATETDVEKLIQIIVTNAVEILNGEAGALLLHTDDDSGDLSFRVVIGGGGDDLIGTRIPKGSGVVGKVIESAESIIVHDVESDPRDNVNVSEFKSRSLLAVPLNSKSKVIGVLEVINKKDGTPFVDEDASLLTTFAGQAAVAIENARLFQQTDLQLAARVKELESLERLDWELNRTLELHNMAETTVRQAMTILGANAGSLGIVNQDPPYLKIVAIKGYTREEYPERADGNDSLIWPLDEGIVKRVLRSRQADITMDVAIDPDYNKGLTDSNSQITLPMMSGDDVFAILILEKNTLPRFSLPDWAFAQRIVEHASLALSTALYIENLKNNNL
jgi:GAF domain-containing protein